MSAAPEIPQQAARPSIAKPLITSAIGVVIGLLISLASSDGAATVGGFPLPLLGGILTRTVVVKKRGLDYFEKGFLPKFNNVTVIGLLLTLVIIFSFQGKVILENPLHIVLIAVPLIIQTFLIFFIAYGASRLLKLPHDIAAPAGMIGASNFFELAVAVAISLFGAKSPVALATIVGVLVEVPVMLTLVKIANRTTHWFPSQTSK